MDSFTCAAPWRSRGELQLAARAGTGGRSGPPFCGLLLQPKRIELRSSAEQLEVRERREVSPSTADGCRQRQGQIQTRGHLKFLKNI